MSRLRIVLAATSVCVAACDPCSTTFSCEQSPRIAVAGQVLDERTGAPTAGAVVSLRVDSGVTPVGPAPRVTTGSSGTFLLEARTVSLGDAMLTITVASPGQATYDVVGIRTRATVLTGEALVFRPWSSARPKLQYVLELFIAGTGDHRLAHIDVTFRRTGGVRMFDSSGAEVTERTARTNEVGWVYPFTGIRTDAAADLIGDLIVRPSAGGDSVVFAGLRFPAMPFYSATTGLVRLPVDTASAR
jgi:hypothetical protein